MAFSHQTVLLHEAVSLLRPGAGRVIVDGTLGGGGHAQALLEAGARVVGIDRDPRALAAASQRLQRFGADFTPVKGNFGELKGLLDQRVDGVLLDLGVSSPQLDEAERGFSFQTDGPLDMRMSDEGQTAAELIEATDEEALADLIWRYGEERFSRRIARVLKEARPQTTQQAVAAVQRAVPRSQWPERTHVATRTFQALRMAVNGELAALDAALAALPEVLNVGGVAAIIAFHSLEDRAVKVAFKALCGEADDPLPRGLPIMPTQKPAAPFRALTKKAVVASDAEMENNPRARSARLRAIVRVS